MTGPDVSTIFEAGCNHVSLDPPAGGVHIASPGVIRCEPCASAYMDAALIADPDLCDSCRKPTAPDDFHEVALVMGPVTMRGNVCSPCAGLVLAGIPR